MQQPATIIEKIWSSHLVREMGGGVALLHVDRHILQEMACSQAFDGLRRRGLSVECPDLTFGVTDHIVSTMPGRTSASYAEGRSFIESMKRNCSEANILLFDLEDRRQGIEHVVAPELGLALPGLLLVCADSHTATNGALGALAWGFGTSDVEHVLATQAVLQHRPRTCRISLSGSLEKGITAKDVVLFLLGKVGTEIGRGHFIEYGGSLVRSLGMEGRMTVCNMTVELGGRCGIIAPDDTTFSYLHGREFAPKGRLWDEAVAYWRTLPSDPSAQFDKEVSIDCSGIAPQVTWGISPDQVTRSDGVVPNPNDLAAPGERDKALRALAYMDLRPGQRMEEIGIDYAFIGSCTNGRLSDLQSAASVLQGRKVADGVRAIAVPGSSTVKREAEALGLHRIFQQAGFEWRESGCSMCLAINDDQVPPGKRCISSSNRNFEHRQGPGSRTHLASPASVAAAAVTGRIADVRRMV